MWNDLISSGPMRWLCISTALLVCGHSLAQKEHFFGTGKPPVFREEDLDRRLARSKVGRMLEKGTDDPNCMQLIGGLLTVLAEIGPTLHKRDENFTVDPHLLHAVNAQLTTPRFPAAQYLAAMVRRVLIDKRLPDSWLATAEAVNPKVQIIDVGKLRFLNDGLKPVDSFLFTLPALRERYDIEVVRATSAATHDVSAEFRDTYLDRDVAWGGAYLIDAGLTAKPKRKKGKKPLDDEPETVVALLEWIPPDPNAGQLQIFEMKKPKPVKIVARLAPRQFVDLARIPKGKRMLVKGRFWEMNRTVTEVEIRDALLFEERDFSQGVLLADPNAVMMCPAAVNELSGLAPQQPGGFRH